MSRYNDDYEDDDELNEDDDEGGLSGSTSRSNPFSSGASVRGAGLPPRPSSPEGGSGSNSPFGSRSGEGSSSSQSGGSPQPFNRNPLGGSGSGNSGTPPARPGLGSSGGSGSGGAPSGSSNPFNRPAGDRPSTPGIPGSGSGSGSGARPPTPTSGTPAARPAFKLDDDDDDKPSGGGSGSFGSRPSSPSSGGSFGSGGNRPGGSGKPDDKKDDKPSGGLGGLGNRFGGGGNKGDDKPNAAKKDEKSGGGGLGGLAGGLTSRFGGGGNKDDKPAAKKDEKSGGGGGLSGLAGGLTSRLPIGGGNKGDDKPNAAKKDEKSGGGGLGGLTSRLPFGGNKEGGDKKKDDKPSGGGLGSRLPGLGGNKQETSAPANRPNPGFGGGASGGSSGSGASSAPSGQRFGSGGSSTPTSGAAFGGGATSSPLGTQKSGASGKPDNKKPAKAGSNVSLMDRVKALNPFAGSAKPAKTRASKGVTVEQDGLTLDNKLDILGIVLTIGALVLLLSSLSPTKGALTETVNGGLSQMFGWGAAASVMVIFAIGVWLLARHFGDEAPRISRIRLVGFGILFVGGLTFAQFLDAFQYAVGPGQDHLSTVRNVFLPIAYTMGRGGGQLGGEIYFVLLSNFGEIGGFLIVILVLIIGVMLSLNLSVSDFAMIAISNFRNVRDAYNRRAQRVAAQRMAKADALILAAAAAAANAPKPAEALPSPMIPALPVPMQASLPLVAEEQRSISISTGGRTSTVSFPTADGAPVAMPTTPTAIPGQPQTVPVQPAAQQPAARGGILGGLRGNKPQTAPATEINTPAASHTEAVGGGDQKSGGLRGLFNRGGDKAAKPEQVGKADQAGGLKPAATVAGIAGGIAATLLNPVRDDDKPAVPAPTPAATFTPVNQPHPTSPTPAPASQDAAASPFGRPTPGIPQTSSPFGSAAAANAERLGDTARTMPVSAERDLTSTPTQPFERPAANVAGTPESTAPAAARPTPTPFQRPTLGSTLGRPAGDSNPLAASSETPAASQPTAPAASTSAGFAPTSAAPTAPRPSVIQTPAAGTPPAVPSHRGTPEQYSPGNPPRQGNGNTAAPIPPASIRESLGGSNGDSQPRPAAPPPQPARRAPKEWKVPDYASLLASGDDQEVDHELLLKRARIIEETLSSFGAPGRVVDVRTGPVVTQFGVEPDYIEVRGGKKNRVKVGAIAALDKDLQLALGARSIRIEAPVPGKGYVGIEVPNEKAEVVRMRDVLESEQFKKVKSKSPLGIALGQGVDGTPVVGDLASMPHLLIAGTTGSGKSVCVNSIICSILLNNTPKQVKFIMVDPKRVELTQYNGIPHLIAPVVVELERIVSVLKWVTREMDERYRKFSQAASRNIEDYNKHLPASEEALPYIVVIIDELADLMMLAPDETERVITRIAALARATGIHLVIATQRPSVDVVTGLIKANFPARIAFAVAGSVDSRVILDQPGAERLLGRGDMLYMSGDSPAPQRLQGVFVSDNEIGNSTRFWRQQVTEEELMTMFRPLGSSLGSDDGDSGGSSSRSGGSGAAVFSRSASGSSSSSSMPWERENSMRQARDRRDEDDDDLDMEDDDDGGDDVGDEMYEQAVEMVRRLNRASVSLLQRRLRIGYTRAARLIDLMEERGVVGPATEGSKPREVITQLGGK